MVAELDIVNTLESEKFLPNQIIVSDLHKLTIVQRENCQAIASGLVTLDEIKTVRCVSEDTVKRELLSRSYSGSLCSLAIRISGKTDQKEWGMFRIITELFRTGVFLQLQNTQSGALDAQRRYMWANYHVNRKHNNAPFDLDVNEKSNLTPTVRENLRLMLFGWTSDKQLSNIRGVSIDTIGKQINGGRMFSGSMRTRVANFTGKEADAKIERPRMLLDLIKSGDIQQVVNPYI